MINGGDRADRRSEIEEHSGKEMAWSADSTIIIVAGEYFFKSGHAFNCAFSMYFSCILCIPIELKSTGF